MAGIDIFGIREEDERRRAIVARRNALLRQVDPEAELTPFRSGLSRVGASIQNIPSNILGTPRAETEFTPFSPTEEQRGEFEELRPLAQAVLGASSSEQFAAIAQDPRFFPDPAAPEGPILRDPDLDVLARTPEGFAVGIAGRPRVLGEAERVERVGQEGVSEKGRRGITQAADTQQLVPGPTGAFDETSRVFAGPVSPAGVTAAARAASTIQEVDPSKDLVQTATGDLIRPARPGVVQAPEDTAIFLLGRDGLTKGGSGPLSPTILKPGETATPAGFTAPIAGQPRLTTLPTEAALAQTGAGGATGIVATGQEPTKVLGVGEKAFKGPKLQAEGWKPITVLSPGELALQVDQIVGAGLPIADNSNAELFKIETPLRDSFLKQTKSFRALGQQFAVISGVFRGEVAPHEVFLRNAKGNTSAARDMAMVFGVMKMLDEISVVREGEQATARNAAGVPDRIRNQWNRMLTGETLTESQRRDFMDVAIDIYEARGVTYKATESEFRKLADLYGVRPEAVAPNLLGQSGPSLSRATPQAPQQQAPAAPSDAAVTASAAALGFNVEDMTDQQFDQATQHAQGAR